MSAGRKNIRHIILFSAIGLALLLIISYIIDFGARHSDNEQMGKVNRLFDGTLNPDIMVFGSSTGEVGISPRIVEQKTGLTVYNFSLEGTRFMQYKNLIRQFADNSSGNQYIVLAESFLTFEKIGAVTSIERYLPHINNENMYECLHEMQPDLTWKCKYIPFYKYVSVSNQYYKNAFLGLRRYFTAVKPKDTLLGYRPVNQQWFADEDEELRKTDKVSISIDSGIVNRYIETIEYLHGKNKKVIIILTPVFSEWSDRIVDFTPITQLLTGISAKTGARFIDFTHIDISNSKANFYNAIHMNATGAEKFSAILGDSVNAIQQADTSMLTISQSIH